MFTGESLLPTGLFFAPIWEVPGEDFPCEFEGPDFCVLLRGLLLGDFDGDTPSEDPDPEQSALQPLFRGLKFTSATTNISASFSFSEDVCAISGKFPLGLRASLSSGTRSPFTSKV